MSSSPTSGLPSTWLARAEAALTVCRLAGRLRGVPDEARFRWAERRYEEIQLAALAGTGYDPMEEYRYLEGSHD